MHVRPLLAAAIAALLAAPAAGQAQSSGSSQYAAASPAGGASLSSPLSLGGWIGYETDDLDGLQLRFDAVVPVQRLAPQLALSVVGSVGYSRLTRSELGTHFTANILKLVPAVRFTLPLNPRVSVYGDAGLGLYWAGEDVDYGPNTASNTDVGFMFRFGVGGFYQVNARTEIGVSFYLDPMLGGYDDTTFSIMAGALFGL